MLWAQLEYAASCQTPLSLCFPPPAQPCCQLHNSLRTPSASHATTSDVRVRFAAAEHAEMAARALAVDEELQPTKASKAFSTDGPTLVACVALRTHRQHDTSAARGWCVSYPPTCCRSRPPACLTQVVRSQRGSRPTRHDCFVLRHAGRDTAHAARLCVTLVWDAGITAWRIAPPVGRRVGRCAGADEAPVQQCDTTVIKARWPVCVSSTWPAQGR